MDTDISLVQRMAESERSLAEAQAISHLGSFTWDVRTGEVSWSDELYRLMGYEPGAIVPTRETFVGGVHVEDRDDLQQRIQSCAETGEHFDCDFRVVHPNGAVRWLNGRARSVMENGRTVRLLGTSQDITLRKEAEEERVQLLAKQKELTDQFRLILDSTGEGIFGVDGDGACTFINQAGAAQFGGTPDIFIGKIMCDLTHRPWADDSVQAEGSVLYGTFRSQTFWRLDGSKFSVEYSSYPLADGGEATGAVVVFKDVTKRNRTELDLIHSEQLFRGAFEAARTGIALITSDGRTYLDVNRALCDMLGYTKDELLALDWFSVTHPDDRGVNLKLVQDFGTGADAFNFVRKRYVRKDGRAISVEISEAVVRDSDGGPLYFVSHITDVSARDQSARSLEESQELFQAVVDNSPAVIYVKRTDGTYVVANDVFLRAFGLERDAVIGSKDHDIFPPVIADVLAANDQKVWTDGPTRVEEDIPHADGTIHTYISVKFPLSDSGQEGELCGISTDITDRVEALDENKRLEGQLRQAQKMEAVGQLAGGVAHDFNNILAVVLNYAEFVADGLEEDDEGQADLRQIVKAGERGAELVHQLLAFSRQEVIQPCVIDLNEVVNGMGALFGSSLGEQFDLTIDTPPGAFHTKADRGQLEQILLNLVTNARDSMPGGGRINIATGDVELEDGARLGLPAGNYVFFTVTDRGTGIDAETLEHIFEPFFTTKARGEGTGLGLATVYGIVKQANGGIYAHSEVGNGTSFVVYLPVTYEEASPPVEPAEIAPVDKATILVVEDEEPVRELIGRILRRDGFEVIDVSAGAAAVDVCSSFEGPIDLLLTDVVMPNMSGPELRDVATPLRPKMKVLFMSGYTDELIAKRGVLEAGDSLLNKPFNSKQLLGRVHEALHTEDAK